MLTSRRFRVLYNCPVGALACPQVTAVEKRKQERREREMKQLINKAVGSSDGGVSNDRMKYPLKSKLV
jgi:hypothetical protein